MHAPASLSGLDRLLGLESELERLRKAPFALLCHPASVTRDYVHVYDALGARGLRPSLLLGPEHGIGGEAQDMDAVGDARNADGVPVRSLYGARFEDLSPRDEDLAGVATLLIDLQDVGARYYTFVWTAVLAARRAFALGVDVVVLDRANPLGTELVEGRVQSPGFLSFVGLEPVPVRHGLSLGEIVAWQLSLAPPSTAKLRVVSHQGDARGAMWVYPSPNMPTRETALVYPGGCLLEGTNLSDGRGMTRPFEVTGAPWVDGNKLATELRACGLRGVAFRPLSFEPTFHKHARQVCGGVQVHVTDAHAFRPVATYAALIAVCHKLWPEHFKFRTETYEFVSDIPAYDLLTGSAEARAMMLRGEAPSRVGAWVSETDTSAQENARRCASGFGVWIP